MMSPEQKRQIEEARREAHEKSDNVCANGEKSKGYDEASNQINNE
jgi:hypothetical protein